LFALVIFCCHATMLIMIPGASWIDAFLNIIGGVLATRGGET